MRVYYTHTYNPDVRARSDEERRMRAMTLGVRAMTPTHPTTHPRTQTDTSRRWG
jgi:hypothetical protein